MSMAGIRSSSTFEALFRDSVADKKLEAKEYQALRQEFKKLNPNGDFDAFLSERLSNKVNISTLQGLASKHDTAPLSLNFPIAEESFRAFGNAKVEMDIHDSNGFANEGRNDLSGTINGSLNMGGVASFNVLGNNIKIDAQDIGDLAHTLGFDVDAKGRLSMDTSSAAGWGEWLASKVGNLAGYDTRTQIVEGLKALGVEARLKEEGGRLILEPQSMTVKGSQLAALGVQSPLSPNAEVKIDLRQSGLRFANGMIAIDLKNAKITGSSNSQSTVDASKAPSSQAESVQVGLQGNVSAVARTDTNGQTVMQATGQDLAAHLKMDVKTLQDIQKRLLSENPQTGPLHSQLKDLGMQPDAIEQLKTASQEVLTRLLRDPNSKLELALKVAKVETGTRTNHLTPEGLKRVQDILKCEDPAKGELHTAFRKSGFDDAFIARLREENLTQLSALAQLPDNADPALKAQANKLAGLLGKAEFSQILATGFAAQGVQASLTSTDGQGQQTGQIAVSADSLTGSIEARRKLLDAQGVKGEASGALTLTQTDVAQIGDKLKEYKELISQKLKDLGLTGEQFNQILQLLSKDNLQSMLASATPAKVTDLAAKLGISEEQTRKLVDFFNTDAIKKSVDDLFRLNQALGANTRVEGKLKFDLQSLGWSQEDQQTLTNLRGVSATLNLQGTSPSGAKVQGSVTLQSDQVNLTSPAAAGEPAKPAVEAGKTTVSTQVGGEIYANEGQPATPQALRSALTKGQLPAFYQGALGSARELETRTGVPASVLLAGVAAQYARSTQPQKAQFDIQKSLEYQAQQISQRYPQAVSAFQASGDVKAFLDKAPELPNPPKPELLDLAHKRVHTEGKADFSTAGARVDSDGTMVVQPGTASVAQQTDANGKVISGSKFTGTFGELSLAERPEMLKAVQDTLKQQFGLPFAQRPMQNYLQNLGLSLDQIKQLRTASAADLNRILQDPQQKAKLAPLINTFKAAAFSVSGNSKADGQTTSATLSGQDFQVDARGTLSLANMQADIVNGQLHFKGSLGRSQTNADFTHLGDLNIVAQGPGLKLNLASPNLDISEQGQATGTLQASGAVQSNGSTSNLAVSGSVQVTLNQGQVTASRISDGRLQADIDVKTLKEMIQSDPKAQAILDSLARQGISLAGGQKVRVILSEADLKNSAGKGTYSGNLELPQLRTSFGPMSLRLNVNGKTGPASGQDIWGNVSFQPKPEDLAELLNKNIRASLELNHTGTRVQVESDKAKVDFSHLLGNAKTTVSADGKSLTLTVDKAKLLWLFDVTDTAAGKVRNMLAERGIKVSQDHGKLVIPVAALNILFQNEMPPGMQIEGLAFNQGVLSGAFRYHR